MDYVVIGTGPAGLQLRYFLAQAGRDHLIVEAAGSPGTFFRTFPRHRRLISINKPHTGWDDPELNLRMDWNSLVSDDPCLKFTSYTGRYFPDADDLVRYLADFAAATRLRISYDTRVVRVTRDGGFRAVHQDGRAYEARRLVGGDRLLGRQARAAAVHHQPRDHPRRGDGRDRPAGDARGT
jgi:flavin-dependent dehydrogenase